MINKGFPDLLSFSALSRNAANVKTRLSTVRTEAVTGRIADISAARGGDVAPVLEMRKSIAAVEGARDAASLAKNRASTMQTGLSQLESGVAALSTNVLAAVGRGDDAALRNYAAQARETLGHVVTALNTQVGGRSLFAGTAVGGPALASADDILSQISAAISGAPDADAAEAALTDFFNDPAGGFSTNVYLGDGGDAGIAEITPGERLSYGVRADAAPIRDMIRGLASLALVDQAPLASGAQTRAFAGAAAGSLLDAEDGVTALRANLGSAEERIQHATAANETALTTLNLSYNDMIGRDQFDAATEMNALASQLKATYMSASRINDLSFLNFMK